MLFFSHCICYDKRFLIFLTSARTTEDAHTLGEYPGMHCAPGEMQSSPGVSHTFTPAQVFKTPPRWELQGQPDYKVSPKQNHLYRHWRLYTIIKSQSWVTSQVVLEKQWSMAPELPASLTNVLPSHGASNWHPSSRCSFYFAITCKVATGLGEIL